MYRSLLALLLLLALAVSRADVADAADCPLTDSSPHLAIVVTGQPPSGASNPRPARIGTEAGMLYDYPSSRWPYLFYTARLGFAFVQIGGDQASVPGGNGNGYRLASACDITLLTGPALTIGDLNGDGRVDTFDLSILALHFGQHGGAIPGDLNGDQVVDIYDLAILSANFSK